MRFKQILNSLSGITTSSNVTVIEKTHFNGKHFKKVIEVEEFLDTKKKDAARLDKMFPKDAPHKIDNLDYRFTFKLDLSNRPEGMKVGDLIENSNYNKNYKIHTELIRPWKVRLLTPTDDGYRTDYLGYKLSSWLEIEPIYIRDGEPDTYMWRGYINLFTDSYASIGELHDGDIVSLLKETITIRESEINVPIQQLLKAETRLFAKECLNAMSPR